MDVVGLAVTGQQAAVHLGKSLNGVTFEVFQRLGIEYFASILGNADQVDGKPRNAVSFASKASVWQTN